MTHTSFISFGSSDVAPWTVDEYARRLAARQHPVHKHDGVWWFEVRRRYCWCLDPFAVPPRDARPAWLRSCVGYQALVADPADANAFFNPMVLDDLPGYGIEKLGSFRRNRVRKGTKSLVVRPLNRPDEFRTYGFKIESEFYARTQWRAPPPEQDWPKHAERAFQDPTIDHMLGAFLGERLVAFMTWFGIERTAHLAHIASGEEGNRACANDALLYSWIMMLRESGQYDRAVYTIRSFKPTLDEFKESHLFRMCSIPIRLVLNPLVRIGLGRFRPHFLERLEGLDEAAARAWIQSARATAASEAPAGPPAAPGQ